MKMKENGGDSWLPIEQEGEEVKKGDSWLLIEQEGEEVKKVIIAGVKIIAEVSLVGAGVLMRGNYVLLRTT